MNIDLEKFLKARIRNLARETNTDPALIWQTLFLERFLIRLSQSPYSKLFIFKGGVLLSKLIRLERETRDLDFTILKKKHEHKQILEILSTVGQIDLKDGFIFRDLSVDPLPHPHMKYSGFKASMRGQFHKAKSKISIDLGYGDFVEPHEQSLSLTRDLKGHFFEPVAKLSCYPVEYIFAEKLQTICIRGAQNSRMKDFHDLYLLINQMGDLLLPKIHKILEQVFIHRQTLMALSYLFFYR